MSISARSIECQSKGSTDAAALIPKCNQINKGWRRLHATIALSYLGIFDLQEPRSATALNSTILNNDGAKLLTTDFDASDGVMPAIDSVIPLSDKHSATQCIGQSVAKRESTM